MAGAQVGEIDAPLLTFKIRSDRPVWGEQSGEPVVSGRPGAVSHLLPLKESAHRETRRPPARPRRCLARRARSPAPRRTSPVRAARPRATPCTGPPCRWTCRSGPGSAGPTPSPRSPTASLRLGQIPGYGEPRRPARRTWRHQRVVTEKDCPRAGVHNPGGGPCHRRREVR